MKLFQKYLPLIIIASLVFPMLSLENAHAVSNSQQLIMGTSVGKVDNVVEVPITMNSDGNVTAIQFQVSYDLDSLELIKVNKGADLHPSFSVLANPDNGMIVIGSIGSSIGPGSKEIAIAVFMIKSTATSKDYLIDLLNVSFTDSKADNLSNQFQIVDGTITVDNSGYIQITGLSLNPTPLNLTLGSGPGFLSATITPSNATYKNVKWRSSNPAVVTVVNGVVSTIGEGKATITATSEDGRYSATSHVTVHPIGTGNDSSPTEPKTTDGDIVVNGKVKNAGTVKTTIVNNQKVTKITIDPIKLEERLATEADGALISIPVATSSDVVIAELNGQIIQNMQKKKGIVEIKTNQASYKLPALQIDMNDISTKLGRNVMLQDIQIQVEISSPPKEMAKIIASLASSGKFALVVPPLNFTVSGLYDSQIIEVSKFNAYVERTFAIPDGVDPNQVATGLVIEKDGTVRHVPTKIVLIDGKYFAKVNSLTNSTYSIVSHPITFKDISEHWAKDAINDMGTRMVINGIDQDLFNPDQDITRAEFAAIIIRGLGLKLESGTAPFSDIHTKDWYNNDILTATAYKLINGYEDGTFRPKDKLTREQAMVMISKAMSITQLKESMPSIKPVQSLTIYSDAGSASSWAVNGIVDSIQAGIVSGRSRTILAPKANITRAEAAIMIQRLLKRSGLI